MTKEEEEKAALAVSANTEVEPKAKPVQQPTQTKKNVTIDTEADMGDEAKASTLIDADAQQANKENAIDRLLKDRIEANKTEQQKLEENYQAQQKRQKRNAIIASVADGLSALSNMYFTSKGAPTPTRQAASMSEQQAKQNVADRNTYLELLQGWRKRNNELLDNYATYQATAAKNKLTQQRLAFEADKEARLWAKQKAQEAYNDKYLELKQKGLDDANARAQAQLAYNYAKLDAEKEIKQQQIALGYYRADIAAAPTKTEYKGEVTDGVYHLNEKTQQKVLKNGKQQ